MRSVTKTFHLLLLRYPPFTHYRSTSQKVRLGRKSQTYGRSSRTQDTDTTLFAYFKKSD